MIIPTTPIRPDHGRTTKEPRMSWQQPRKPGIPVEVKGKCPVCGKPATVKSRIDSTHPNGGVKTLEQIAAEEAVLRSKPVTHIKCQEVDQ